MSKIQIEGNNNQVFSNIKKSSINSNLTSGKGTARWIGIGSLVVAAIGVLINLIVNWETVIIFFTK